MIVQTKKKKIIKEKGQVEKLSESKKEFKMKKNIYDIIEK